MTKPTRQNVGRLLICAASALLISVAGTACASANRSRLVLVQTRPVAAPIVPGSWDQVERLEMGSLIVVQLKGGPSIDGTFKGLAPTALTLTDAAGQSSTIARSEIAVILCRRGDTLTNGALIGAGVGLGSALTVLALASSGDDYVLDSARWGAPLLLGTIGLATGMLIDRAHKGEKVIYTAAP